MYFKPLLVAGILLSSFGVKAQINPALNGNWLGAIVLAPTEKGMDVPFNMSISSVKGKPSAIEIRSAADKIVVKEIEQQGDSIFFKMPVFVSELTFKAKGDSLVGRYYPKGKGKGVSYKFYALKNVTDRFPWFKEPPKVNVSGRWKYIVNPNTANADTLVAEFKQQGARFTGSILDPTGDMRFLEGKIAGNRFYMSGFDGGRASIFTAEVTSEGSITNGKMMTSPTYKPTWIAIKDEKAKIAESKDLIRIKAGIKSFKFSVKDLGGNTFTSDDPSLKGKVLIVQASGSWCPNCLDETRLYKTLYEKYHSQGLEIVSLMFEENDLESSKYRIQRFVNQTGAKYNFYYAGPRSKKNKEEVLYPFEGVVAFPTTVFIDKKGEIRTVHTGFSGPGTGSHYTELVKEVTSIIEELLKE
jgi:thiol-disulfide isomerase/thioredoxin